MANIDDIKKKWTDAKLDVDFKDFLKITGQQEAAILKGEHTAQQGWGHVDKLKDGKDNIAGYVTQTQPGYEWVEAGMSASSNGQREKILQKYYDEALKGVTDKAEQNEIKTLVLKHVTGLQKDQQAKLATDFTDFNTQTTTINGREAALKKTIKDHDAEVKRLADAKTPMSEDDIKNAKEAHAKERKEIDALKETAGKTGKEFNEFADEAKKNNNGFGGGKLDGAKNFMGNTKDNFGKASGFAKVVSVGLGAAGAAGIFAGLYNLIVGRTKTLEDGTPETDAKGNAVKTRDWGLSLGMIAAGAGAIFGATKVVGSSWAQKEQTRAASIATDTSRGR